MDDGATRRIRPGTKAEDMMTGPPLVPLVEVSYRAADWTIARLQSYRE